ncbi:5-formyltetrahydrofolate cyclo-ligase [Colwelliaceae bacterium BS250]
MSTTNMTVRNSLRKLIRSRRQQLSALAQTNAALSICQQLTKHPKIIAANSVALYLANDGELNLSAFIDWCFEHNKKVYLPVLHPFAPGHLLFLHYQKDSILVTNKYGILEPKLDVRKVLPVASLDVLITPLVAFDSIGNRLGMGGGFYDRTLSHWQKHHALNLHISDNNMLYPLGVAHDCQEVDNIPIEHWDIPLPEIITPAQSHRWP